MVKQWRRLQLYKGVHGVEAEVAEPEAQTEDHVEGVTQESCHWP